MAAQYYDFFFSFSSLDWKKGRKDDLQLLFNQLKEKLRSVALTDGGFFAPDELERGHRWGSELQDALRGSRVLVPLYSPNYFRSIYCGKEWQVFSERFKENEQSPHLDITAPDVILPLIWTADLLDYPDGVVKLQNDEKGSDPDMYYKKGLRFMMESPKRYGQTCRDFLEKFSVQLAKMANTQGAKKMRYIPAWDALVPPFPKGYKPGLEHVRYVFLAGRKDQMKKMVERTQTECYGIFEDRRDWRPCFPDDRDALDIARSVAAGHRKGFELVLPDADLLKKLEEAKELKNVIVVVVDPWSLNLNAFRDFANAFDEKEFPTSVVLVNWNENDNETMIKFPALTNKVAGFFKGRHARQEFYLDSVKNIGDFQQGLIQAFAAVQTKLVESGLIRSAESGNDPGQPLLKV